METMNLGSCCICESRTDVNNVLQLDYKVKSESGWGCFVCGLPAEGAVACFCDACLHLYGPDSIEPHLRFLMNGAEGRIPVPPPQERIPHAHDLHQHPEEYP